MINNAGTGGFLLTVRGVTPTTGVTLVDGERAVVAWNGTDFVKVATNLAGVPSINGGQLAGTRNQITNGAMLIDQRNSGVAQTITAGAALAYTVDRWYGYCTGANVTGQQVAGSTTPTVTQKRYRFTGAASVTAVGFGQRIEQKNSYFLAGSTCTLSADLAISATLTTVTWTAYYATTTADTFGSLASPTVTQIATGTFTVGATVTNFTTNISVPAAATTGIQILFTVGALTAGLTWTIGDVQLELGPVATTFEKRSYGLELMLCQRYYEYLTTENAGVSFYIAGTQYGYVVKWSAEKRVIPTLTTTYYSGGAPTLITASITGATYYDSTAFFYPGVTTASAEL
jgi:hypothetical protein